MYQLITFENVLFIPIKLVDNERAIRYAYAPDGCFAGYCMLSDII